MATVETSIRNFPSGLTILSRGILWHAESIWMLSAVNQDLDLPRLVVSIPSALSFRNVGSSGLAEALARQTKLTVATIPAARQDLEIESQHWGAAQTWEYRPSGYSKMYQLFLRSVQDAFFDRYKVNTRNLLNQYRHRDKPRSLRQRFHQWSLRSLAPLGRTRSGWQWLKRKEERWFHGTVPAEYVEAIRSAGFHAGLSTVFKHEAEWPLFRTLQRIGVPTAAHVLSFDNLTSVGYLPILGFDRYLCWSGWLADQLVDFYEIPRNRIEITGTPQFDFHVLPDFAWDREQTARELGIDSTRPYLLYCANMFIQTPEEPPLVCALVDAFRNDHRLRELQWVVRLHPYDDPRRWQFLDRLSGGPIPVSHPCSHSNLNSLDWGQFGRRETALLTNSIRHSDLVMSIGSTIALDCAVLDRPIVNVGFHPDRGSIEDRYYHNAHHSYHYEPITASGAAPVASSLTELLALARQALDAPRDLAAPRRALRDKICGPVDGKAAERIARAVLDLLPGAKR